MYKEIPNDCISLFEYSESSHSGLIWKVNRYSCSGVQLATKGQPAGSKTSYGYWVVPINNKYYKVHRVIWKLIFGLSGSETIDHINRDRSDNRISNLRKVTTDKNHKNRSKLKSNSSGFTGVEIREEKVKDFIYLNCIARWNDLNGKRHSKRFSVQKLGLLPAYAAACAYRESQIEKLNSCGAGYTLDHGK